MAERRKKRKPTLSEQGQKQAEAREARLGEALRANLKRRKEQARARSKDTGGADESDGQGQGED